MRTCLRFMIAFLLLQLPQSASAQQPRPRVAVVLSGGGAKGVAHIGVLKVLEKAGIPVDIVTGTSMGSIVGGLYSIGYTAMQLDSLVREQDWSLLLSDNDNPQTLSLDERRKVNTYIFNRTVSLTSNRLTMPAGIISGKNLDVLFRRLTDGYNDSIDFNSLPRRFACVSTDIVTNTEYVFHSGVLSEAMRSSMSIPAAFAPVRKGSMILVDGGLRNNYPADIAREMGADIIIGVTVQGPPKTADDLTGTMSLIGQIVDVNCKNKYEDNLSITDIPIRVNTKPYGTASFTREAIDTLIRRGEEEAMKHWDSLVSLRRSLGLNDGEMGSGAQSGIKRMSPEAFVVSGFGFSNMSSHDERFLRSKFHLSEGMRYDISAIEQVVGAMDKDLFYEYGSYDLRRLADDSYEVTFIAGRKKTANVNVGARFDTEEMAAIQMNAELPLHTSSPLNLDVTLRLGKRIKSAVEMVFYPISTSKVSLSYGYDNVDINVYSEGNRAYNNVFGKHTVDLTFLDFNIRNFNVTINAQWDYYHHGDLLSVRKSDSNDDIRAVNNEHFYSYNAAARYDSENDWYFPTRGVRFDAGYGYYTDNFAGYRGHTGFSVIDAMWRMSFAANERLSVQPMLYGRLLLGSDVPYIMKNLVGGSFFAHYMAQQLPFAGIGNVEIMDNQFMAVQLRVQERLFPSFYLIGKLSLAQCSEKLSGYFDGETLWGMQFGGYYKSMFGPLGASLGWSNRTDKPFFYVNLGYEF